MSVALDNFHAAPVQELSNSGVTLRYRVFGDGPPVLLLHGWPLSGVTYRELIEALRPHYRCYVPDLPGAGDTPWSHRIHETMHGYTEVLRAFVDQLALDRLAIIGHDTGAGAARLLAAQLGPRVSCLILQNTELPNHYPFMVRLFKLGGSSNTSTAALTKLLHNAWFRRSPLAFGGCFDDKSLIEGEFYRACVTRMLAGMQGHNEMLGRLDLKWTDRLDETHARIGAPIHLFWGGSDKYFPLALARKMHANFVQPGQFEVIERAKLFVHEEAAAELSRFCLPLLASAFADERAVAGARRSAAQS